jgi:hypothetical protein
MANDISSDQMQAKIAAARREAEGLKDRIKRKKDDLADTSCISLTSPPHLSILTLCSKTSRTKQHRTSPANRHEAPSQPQRPSRQNLRHALVHRSATSRVRLARWQAYHLGRLHHQQSPRHPSPQFLGHDLRVCPERKLCRLRWFGQYLLHLQSIDTRWTDEGCKRAQWTQWIPQLLQVCK